MGTAWQAVALFASLALVGHAGGLPPGPAAIEHAHPAPAGREYRPYHDPTILFAEHAAEHLSRSLFGWHDVLARWNLTLDKAIDGEGFAAGVNDAGQPFTLDASFHLEAPADVEGYEPGACSRGVWSGALTAGGTTIIASGLVFSAPDRGTTIVPLVVPVDQAAAWADHQALISFGRDVGPRDSRCKLDPAAEFALRQNQINAEACRLAARNTMLGTVVICTSVGIAACWFTFGAGCIGAIVCDAAVLFASEVWRRDFIDEWNRATQCLCLESAWRRENPTAPLPAESCGTFRCPRVQLIPVKLS